jgi:hypothetical protein
VTASGCGDTTTSLSTSAAAQHGLMRGLWDDSFVGVDKANQDAILSEIADQLHVNIVRLMAFRDKTESPRGVFVDSYLASIRQAVEAARAHGLKVILTTCSTPKWAQDRSFWKQPSGDHFNQEARLVRLRPASPMTAASASYRPNLAYALHEGFLSP